MKIVAFNRNPHKDGNTYEALKMSSLNLENQGIEVEIVHVGNKLIHECVACGQCARNRNERC